MLSQNYAIIWFGKPENSLLKIPSKSLLKAAPVLLRLLTVLFGQVLNFSKEEDSTTSWGTFSQSMTSLMMKSFFSSTGNLQCCRFFRFFHFPPFFQYAIIQNPNHKEMMSMQQLDLQQQHWTCEARTNHGPCF